MHYTLMLSPENGLQRSVGVLPVEVHSGLPLVSLLSTKNSESDHIEIIQINKET